MRMEGASRGGSEIGDENVNKVGKYLYKNIKQQYTYSNKPNKDNNHKPITCFYCGDKTTNLPQRRDNCKGAHNKCSICSKYGHLPSVCRRKQDIKKIAPVDNDEQDNDTATYSVNLFVINSSKNMPKPKLKHTFDTQKEFSVQVVVNNTVDKVLADTGAKVSVCGTIQAKKWGIFDKTIKSKIKIQPYKSDPIPVYDSARCAVSFWATSLPVEWHIISGH